MKLLLFKNIKNIRLLNLQNLNFKLFLIQLKLYFTFHLPCNIQYTRYFCSVLLYYKISIKPTEIFKPQYPEIF